jgi:hypothetical protein
VALEVAVVETTLALGVLEPQIKVMLVVLVLVALLVVEAGPVQ